MNRDNNWIFTEKVRVVRFYTARKFFEEKTDNEGLSYLGVSCPPLFALSPTVDG